MANVFTSFGLALLVTMQGATIAPAEVSSSNHPAVQPEHTNAVQAASQDTPAKRPRIIRRQRTGAEPPRPEGRPTLAPRRLTPSVAPEKPRVEQEPTKRPQSTTESASGERVTEIVRLRHVPAIDTAKTIEEWLKSEEKATRRAAATVVASVITNSLVITGDAKQLESIVDVVRALDLPSPQVRVKAMLVELVLSAASQSVTADILADKANGDLEQITARLKERGDLRVLARPELLIGDNQPGFLQLGGRVPKITGVTTTSRGHSNQVVLENLGTILGVTCRVSEDDLVTLEVDLERSHLGAEEEGTPIATTEDGRVVRSPQMKTLTVQTTVSLRSGQTVLLGGMVHQSERQGGEVLLLLQAEIIR